MKGTRNNQTLFAVNIYSVFPYWPIPKAIQKRMSYNQDIRLTFSISLTFYHVPSKRFFGSTYIGYENEHIPKPDRESDCFLLNELVYFSPKYDRGDDQLLVVELIATEYNRKTETKEGIYGCGWTLVRIPTIKDAERRKSVIQEYRSVPLNLGSPKILLRMTSNEVRDIYDSSVSSGFQVQYELWVCSPELCTTLRSRSLIKEDELIGATEPIAGLRPTKVTAPKEREFAGPCIGGPSTFKDSSGYTSWKLTPAYELHLASQIPIYLSAIRLVFPHGRTRFETSIVTGTLKTHPYIEVPRDQVKFLGISFRRNTKSKLIRVTKASITRRALRVGVHNGHSLIGGDDKWSEIELQPSNSDPNVLAGSKNMHNMPIFYDHSFCAIVVLLKYYLELSVSAYDRSAFRSYSKRLYRAAQCSVTAGYQIILPFHREGVYQDPIESLSVHFPLLHDTLCANFSDSPIHTPSSLKEAMLDLQVQWKLPKSNAKNAAPKAIQFIASDIDTHVSSLTCPSIRNKETENVHGGRKASKIGSKKEDPIDSGYNKHVDEEHDEKLGAVQVSTQTGGSLQDATSSKTDVDPINKLQSIPSVDYTEASSREIRTEARRLVEIDPCLRNIINKISGYVWDKHDSQTTVHEMDCAKTANGTIKCALDPNHELCSSATHDAFYMTILSFVYWYRHEKKQTFLSLHVRKISKKN